MANFEILFHSLSLFFAAVAVAGFLCIFNAVSEDRPGYRLPGSLLAAPYRQRGPPPVPGNQEAPSDDITEPRRVARFLIIFF